jgi:hypothetical protein
MIWPLLTVKLVVGPWMPLPAAVPLRRTPAPLHDESQEFVGPTGPRATDRRSLGRRDLDPVDNLIGGDVTTIPGEQGFAELAARRGASARRDPTGVLCRQWTESGQKVCARKV